MGGGAAGAQALGPEDRVYVPLPLYHSAGGVMAAVGALLSGGGLVLARRFSASRFWTDCARFEATSFQYIGELCRYLLNTPEHPDERRHRVRVCIGNGLRPEIWGPFQERFGIPRIIEFYGATEGNVALMNFDGRVGAVGRMPRLVRRLLGIELIRYDVAKDAHERDARGFCIPCRPGEVGEAIGRLSQAVRFEGYTSPEATEKKILRDVFKQGDAYFRTGDLLRQDDDDYFYFVDRIGDTFRWKGENVSTSEVAEALSVCPGVLEANVYGVAVPGQDGRAGMAALVVDAGFDPAGLAERAKRELPAYARPLFVRLQPEIETTGTFKHRKVDLVSDGFDPAKISDPLFFLDGERGYVPLDAALHARIVSGEVRV
jgi:fatty-acyl-CoA synthase